MLRHLGVLDACMLTTQSNIARSYQALGQNEQALQIQRDVYSGTLKLDGEEHRETLVAAFNYAISLQDLERFEEAKSLLLKTMPVARRVLGNNNETTLTMRLCYARTLYENTAATLDDIREAITTLEDAERIARRVLGGANPTTKGIEAALRQIRASLRAREPR